MCRESIKNAIEVKEYQILYHLRELRQQIGNAKMTNGIFDTERVMSIYGYCRISTAKQSIDRQIRNIKAEYPTAHIVQEAYTGTSIFRPEWLKLYRVLKAGDTVVFDSVSRMSRNAEEGFALYDDLYHKGIRLVFLKEHHIDTET